VTVKKITLRGVATHNLKAIDLEIPHGQLLAVCGPSGSGKSSLIVDTLYAEGQRRYVESFSPYARQYLDQVEKPPADRLDGIPPSVVAINRIGKFGRRATVASTTELLGLLQLFFAKAARVVCPDCDIPIERARVESVTEAIKSLPDGTRLQIGFDAGPLDAARYAMLKSTGFLRVIVNGETLTLEALADQPMESSSCQIIVDRIKADSTESTRIAESLRTALHHGGGALMVWSEHPLAISEDASTHFAKVTVDGRGWMRQEFFVDLICPKCRRQFSDAEPNLFSESSPLGACPDCEGLGESSEYDMALIVPDDSKSIAEDAIAPWASPAYVHERDELMELAADYGIDVDAPWKKLSKAVRQRIWEGVPERKFGGLSGFFRWLEKRRYKMHLRIFAARWRSFSICQTCQGDRLRTNVLSYRVAEKTLIDVLKMDASAACEFFEGLNVSVVDAATAQIHARIMDSLRALQQLGLGYLPLSRTMRNLSLGEQQRVLIARMLRTSLVNLLYVFDEPTSGLHPLDAARVIDSIVDLHRRSNTVAVADHNRQFLSRCERIIELGPGSGERGGNVVFDGSFQALQKASRKASSGRAWLIQSNDVSEPRERRSGKRQPITLSGCTGRNLKGIDVSFPAGVICQVIGVSGSGKATLVRDTLFAHVARELGLGGEPPLPFESARGDAAIDGAILIDESPLTRTARSNPATFVKAYDPIRKLFAETEGAKKHRMTARHFSFNVAGGRCDKCQGVGVLNVDMHFLGELRTVCDECSGRRFRPEVLEARYRGMNIVEVLEMSAQQAFPFFRGERKIQVALKSLMDAGLGYLRLGQSLNTLSTGEERRLRLAPYLGSTTRGRSLYVIMRPTFGLHPGEIPRLVDAFDSLVDVGHSLIIVDNDLRLAHYADWLIEMGPGAGDEGGEVVFAGVPEDLPRSTTSPTAEFLRASTNGK
jgi:excinuclease ABC subunit A